MSYILEALNRSQKERELGNVPTLATPTAATARTPKRLPHIALSALLLALCAVLIALYAAFGTRFSITDGTGTAAPRRPPPREADAAPRPASEAPRPAPTPKPAQSESVQPQARSQTTPTTPAATPGPTQYEANSQNLRADLEKIRDQVLRDSLAPAPATTAPAPAPAPAETERSTHGDEGGATPDTFVDADLPRFEELPESLRQAMPPYRISVHVYSEVPERRFVILNSRKTGEGGQTSDGLRVVEIRNDGVVMQYQGRQFLQRR